MKKGLVDREKGGTGILKAGSIKGSRENTKCSNFQ